MGKGNRANLATHSTWFENIQEHRFIIDLSHSLYHRRGRLLNVLRSEVDAFGFDLTVSDGHEVRNIQLKARANKRDAPNSYQISESLWQIEGACVIWIMWDFESFNPHYYHLFGCPMPPIRKFTKGKGKRRLVSPRAAKHRRKSIDEICDLLFGIATKSRVRSGKLARSTRV